MEAKQQKPGATQNANKAKQIKIGEAKKLKFLESGGVCKRFQTEREFYYRCVVSSGLKVVGMESTPPHCKKSRRTFRCPFKEYLSDIE
jgi:hypothetical protein